jgi:hypothetical protein
MRLASAHWQLCIGKGGVTKYFECVQKDFSKEIGRPFISTRRKITTTYEYYALLFNDKGSGTGIQSESELVGVMRIFVISGIKRRQMLARRRLTVALPQRSHAVQRETTAVCSGVPMIRNMTLCLN